MYFRRPHTVTFIPRASDYRYAINCVSGWTACITPRYTGSDTIDILVFIILGFEVFKFTTTAFWEKILIDLRRYWLLQIRNFIVITTICHVTFCEARTLGILYAFLTSGVITFTLDDHVTVQLSPSLSQKSKPLCWLTHS